MRTWDTVAQIKMCLQLILALGLIGNQTTRNVSCYLDTAAIMCQQAIGRLIAGQRLVIANIRTVLCLSQQHHLPSICGRPMVQTP